MHVLLNKQIGALQKSTEMSNLRAWQNQSTEALIQVDADNAFNTSIG